MTITFKDFEDFKNTFSKYGLIVTREVKKKGIDFKIGSVKDGIDYTKSYIVYGLNDTDKITKKFMDFYIKEVITENSIFQNIVKPFLLTNGKG